MDKILEYLSRVIGPPGCGKTTYLARQCEVAVAAGHSVLVCSLTRTAAAEIAGRDLPIPPTASGTLHAHAYRSLGCPPIADTTEGIKHWNEDFPNYQLTVPRNLDGDSDDSPSQESAADEQYSQYNLFRARMTSQEEWGDLTRAFARQWEEWKAANGYVDFTDMLGLALDEVPYAPHRPSVIFADESQDFSRLEMTLLRKWGNEAGHLVIVGDPYQSIYEWRGADPDVFFEGEVTQDNFRILPQSYRVPQEVHSSAMGWLRQMPEYQPIEYHPTSETGVVDHSGATWKQPEEILSDLEHYLVDGKSVMFLASCAYMLNPLIQVLRREGIPFHNLYRRKNRRWNPLQQRRGQTSASDRVTAFLRLSEQGEWRVDDIQTWLTAVRTSEVLYKGAKTVLETLPPGEVLPDDLCQLFDDPPIEAGLSGDLGWFRQRLLASRQSGTAFPITVAERGGSPLLWQTPQVTVGTIHSVKGSEADVVYLCPDLSNAGADTWHTSRAGRASVFRLFYVGMTRAKETLCLLRGATPQAVRLV